MEKSESPDAATPATPTGAVDPLIAVEALTEDDPSRDDRLLTAYLHKRHIACPKCGYDLCDCRTGACPECGEPVRIQIERARPHVTTMWITTVVFLAMGSGLGLPVVLLVVLSRGRAFDAGILTCSMLVFVACIPILPVTIMKRDAFARAPREQQVAWAMVTSLGVGLALLLMLGMMLGLGRW